MSAWPSSWASAHLPDRRQAARFICSLEFASEQAMVAAVDAAKALLVGSPEANGVFRFANAYREAWLVVGVLGSAELRDDVARLLDAMGGSAVEVDPPVIEQLIRRHLEHGGEGVGAGG